MSLGNVPKTLQETLSRFADRLFLTGGVDPGDDALELPPERLAVYHELVRRNYMSMLRFAYTMSFRLIAHELETCNDDAELPAGPMDIVRHYLETCPVDTHSTRAIADSFRPFVEGEYPALFDRLPELRDLMSLERAELKANYEWDDPGRSPTPQELEDVVQAPVDEFLGLRLLRAPSASVLRTDYPAATLYHRLRHREFPARDELTGPEMFAVTRDPDDLRPVVTHLEEPAFLVYSAAPDEGEVGAEELAAAWLGTLPAGFGERDDEWKLRTFATAVVTGLRTGFFRLVE